MLLCLYYKCNYAYIINVTHLIVNITCIATVPL